MEAEKRYVIEDTLGDLSVYKCISCDIKPSNKLICLDLEGSIKEVDKKDVLSIKEEVCMIEDVTETFIK